jgi:hypothetical protein
MPTRRRHGSVPAFAALVAIGTGCSGGDELADRENLPAVVDVSEPTTRVTAAPASDPDSSAPAPAPAPATMPPTSAARTVVTTTTLPPATVPEATGVPGLDSADAFCAAWSRFGGTWQVSLAAGAFAGADESARLEVIAAPVVGEAYSAIFAAWPDELAPEQDLVADAYFGAFQRRSVDALAALDRAGAQPAQLDALADLWVAALGSRDPSNPVLEVALPDDLASVVDAATADFASQRTALVEDPSMVITASTPLTDEYLATACPDQGAITGSDVIGG